MFLFVCFFFVCFFFFYILTRSWEWHQQYMEILPDETDNLLSGYLVLKGEETRSNKKFWSSLLTPEMLLQVWNGVIANKMIYSTCTYKIFLLKVVFWGPFICKLIQITFTINHSPPLIWPFSFHKGCLFCIKEHWRLNAGTGY